MAHKAYWTENGSARSKDFSHDQLGELLKFTESLRLRRRNGEDISFIATSSEIPECVGEMGVDVTGPDYNWTKRRTTALRKDTEKK